MKALYYLESARSIDINGQPIPAKKLKWHNIFGGLVAYEDREMCDIERLVVQENLGFYIIRVKKAGFFKNFFIRYNSKRVGDWVIRKG